MIESKLRKFAKDCSLSTNMIARSSYIIKLLETVSSGLPKKKHNELTTYMCDILSSPIKNSSLNEQIIETFNDWSVEELSRSMKYIGTYFHLLNQAELNEIIYINERRDIKSDIENPKVDSIPSAVKFMKNNSVSFNKAKEIISNISIHPTFTAHPTETRRPSIIKKQRMLLQIIDTILNEKLSHTKRSRLENEAVRLCRLIMFTGDVRSHDISVKDEINNTLKSTINSLWHAVSELSYDLESSFEQYYKEKVQLDDLFKQKHDKFHPTDSHVIPSLIKRVGDGEYPLKVAGDGTAVRDFIHVNDVVNAIQVMMNNTFRGVIDVGTGVSNKLVDIVDYFKIDYKSVIGDETERQDNTADTSILNKFGWRAKINLYDYIEQNKVVN